MQPIIFLALLTFIFGLFSRLSERSPITAPMVFVAVGIGVSPLGLNLFHIELNATFMEILAEVTLIEILFVDASTIRLRSLIREQNIPFRLLFLGLPLTMLFGVLLAIPIFSGMNLWLIGLLAFILAPTDAALGQAVVKSEQVPETIRQSITVESGLNDGIAVPPILFCIAGLSMVASAKTGAEYWIDFTLMQLIISPFVGAFVGWVGGVFVDKASRAGWMNPTFQRLAAGSLAILAYALSKALGGNGFIAAFFGGLFLGTRTHDIRERIQEFGEAEGQQLSLFVFLMFGLSMVPEAAPYWNGRAWLYAILSLTVIRMIPVAISLLGAKLDWFDVTFIGWFGPRGIASVVFLLMTIHKLGLPDHEQVLSVIVLTILLSVFLHGLTAVPLASLYGKRSRRK